MGVLSLAFGICREPPSLHPFLLLKDFQYAPEAGEREDPEQGRQYVMAGQQRGRGAAQPSEEKCPPAFRAEVVFGFDYYRVEYPYHQECGYAYNQTCEIHFGNF